MMCTDNPDYRKEDGRFPGIDWLYSWVERRFTKHGPEFTKYNSLLAKLLTIVMKDHCIAELRIHNNYQVTKYSHTWEQLHKCDSIRKLCHMIVQRTETNAKLTPTPHFPITKE